MVSGPTVLVGTSVAALNAASLAVDADQSAGQAAALPSGVSFGLPLTNQSQDPRQLTEISHGPRAPRRHQH
jgi:hypothetical protein